MQNGEPPATSASTRTSNRRSPRDAAIEFVCDAAFHRSLTVPATDKHGPLRVTYATTRSFEVEDAGEWPTILYCGPLSAMRYMVQYFNHALRMNGVEMVCVDRPGVGGSSPVPLDQRVDVWLETVPLVLEKLGLRHVALVSHSAGTIYLLNALLRLPHILDPYRPFVALQAPWVHQDHSHVGLLNFVHKLPQAWIGSWGSIAKFIGTTIVPSIGYSSGVLENVAGVFREESPPTSEDVAEMVARHGADEATLKEIGRLQRVYQHSEDSSGISQDALLCLKKGGSYWGACDDYPAYVEALVKQLKQQQEVLIANNNSEQPRRKLRVMALFAETDMMIGKGGQRYFEECWRKAGVEEVVDFESITVRDSNHETIISPQKDGLSHILNALETI